MHPAPPTPRPAPRFEQPDLPQALALYGQRAAYYDRELALFEPLRRQAVAALALQPGDSVLDMGCGTGLSLPLLAQAVGPRGHVLGIEPSPEMLSLALARVEQGGWHQVALLEHEAAQAPLALAAPADAALFQFTHDVLQQPQALAHVLAHLRPGARVVACGLQWAPWWAWGCNSWVMAAALYSATTVRHLHAPWQALADLLPDLQVQPCWWGTMFMAIGHKPS